MCIKLSDTVHHQRLRLSLGARRTYPIESLYVEAKESSLENRRIKLGVQYATFYPFNVSFISTDNLVALLTNISYLAAKGLVCA